MLTCRKTYSDVAGPRVWNRKSESGQNDVDFLSKLVDAVKTPVRDRIDACDMVTVIGKLLPGCESRSLAHNLVTLDHQPRAVAVNDDPLPAKERDVSIGAIRDCDVVDERVRFVRREGGATMVMDETVETGGEAG